LISMEVTEEMLDVIEIVKGKRNPGLWDPRCQQYFDNQRTKKTKKKKQTTSSVKEVENS